MTRLLLNVLLVALLLTVYSDRALPAGLYELPVLALHAKTVTKLGAMCTTQTPNAQGLNCMSYTTDWGLFTGTYVYIVVGHGPDEGVAGTSFGIDYDPQLHAVDYVNFTQCADGEALPNDGGNGDFPAAGGGMQIAWDICQQQIFDVQGVHAVVGAIYMYAYVSDVMSVTPNNNLPGGLELAVTTCPGDTIDILDELAFDPYLVRFTLGAIQFGPGNAGYTPCHLVPVLPTTWGKIKSRYSVTHR